MWTTASLANELDIIAHVCELQKEHYMLTGSWPDPRDIQRALHGTPKDEPPPPKAA